MTAGSSTCILIERSVLDTPQGQMALRSSRGDCAPNGAHAPCHPTASAPTYLLLHRFGSDTRLPVVSDPRRDFPIQTWCPP
jgi:hypothetical protein